MDALDAGGHGRGAAVGGLARIDLEVVVGENGAADRGDENSVLADAQLVDDLGHQTVGDAVGAAGAVVGIDVSQRLGPGVDDLFAAQVGRRRGDDRLISG